MRLPATKPISEPSPAQSSSCVPSPASPCGVPAAVPFSERAEWAKAGIGIVAGVAITLAVEVWMLFDFGFIRLRDPLAGEKAVAAAYWDEVYTRAEVCTHDEMNGEGP